MACREHFCKSHWHCAEYRAKCKIALIMHDRCQVVERKHRPVSTLSCEAQTKTGRGAEVGARALVGRQ